MWNCENHNLSASWPKFFDNKEKEEGEKSNRVEGKNDLILKTSSWLFSLLSISTSEARRGRRKYLHSYHSSKYSRSEPFPEFISALYWLQFATFSLPSLHSISFFHFGRVLQSNNRTLCDKKRTFPTNGERKEKRFFLAQKTNVLLCEDQSEINNKCGSFFNLPQRFSLENGNEHLETSILKLFRDKAGKQIRFEV